MGFECVSQTHVGLRRKVNEDSMLARTERGLWAVADGMGGHAAGDVASATVTDALQKLPIVYSLDALVDSAVAAIVRANRDLIALAHSEGESRTIGTTVVGLAIAGPRYVCFWAGDSRAYRIRGGKIEQLSRDHSLVQELVDAGMIEPGDAESHANANIVTRAVGVVEDIKVDTVGGDVQPGDLFLLASDGLTRVVSDTEIADELVSRGLEEAVAGLVEMVLDRGAPDNVSMIAVRVV